MGAATLKIKRLKRGVHQIAYSDGGLQGHTVRWIIHGELLDGKQATVDGLCELLVSMREGASVYMVHQAPIGRATYTASARVGPKTACAVIALGGILLERLQAFTPGQARPLIRRYNSAAYQVQQNNFAPMNRLFKSLQRGQPPKADS